MKLMMKSQQKQSRVVSLISSSSSNDKSKIMCTKQRKKMCSTAETVQYYNQTHGLALPKQQAKLMVSSTAKEAGEY
jgi:hypothetical protein